MGITSALLKLDKLDRQLYYSIKGDFEKSNKLLLELLKERPGDNKIIYNSAFMYLRRGEIYEGMKRLNQGRLANIFGNRPINFPLLRDTKDVKGKKIVVNLEGGFGDNFVGLKFARELSKLGAIVIVLCPKPLHCLLKHQSYISEYYENEDEIIGWVDAWLPSMASEYIFAYKSYHDLPNDPHLFFPYAPLESEKIKVGIKFRGGTAFNHDKYRSPYVKDIVDCLYRIKESSPEVEFFSLEKDPIELPDWIHTSELRTWCDTAELVQQMNVVISTCTSVAHLSAGLGKKTIVMVPILPYWLWAYEHPEGGSWYYNSLRLIRQITFGKWEDVLDKVSNVLLEMV